MIEEIINFDRENNVWVDMIKISVIVPIYKTEKYLGHCIESILNQTYTNIELILVDDGSPDHCGQICDQYAQKDSRIIVIHKSNGGVCSARNQGIEKATGEYLTFVDSDDWIEPEMYERMMGKAIEYDSDMVMCDCIKDSEDHSIVYTHDIREGFYDYEQLRKEYYPHLLMMENVEYPATISNWLILYRIEKDGFRNLTSSLRYVEGIRYSEDLLFGAELMLNVKSFYYMKGSCYYHYRMNPLSASHSYDKDKWKNYILLYTAVCNRLQGYNYDFSEQQDKMLLFFLFNAAGEVIGNKSLKSNVKIRAIRSMLETPETHKMFRKLKIRDLPISNKQKIVTALFKYRWIYLYIVLRG